MRVRVRRALRALRWVSVAILRIGLRKHSYVSQRKPRRHSHAGARSILASSAMGNLSSSGAHMSHPAIAVVDDDEDTCRLLSDRLRGEGYKVTCYYDALSALDDMASGRRPDLILLDLMMPGMNGWEFRVE